MKPTPHLRFINRVSTVPGHPTQTKGTRILQQWHEAEGWEHEKYVRWGGEWQDVELLDDTPEAPL